MRLLRDGRPEFVLRHVRIRIPGRADIDFLRGVEPPQPALVCQGFQHHLQVPWVGVLGLDHEFRDRRTAATVRFTLAPPGGIGLAPGPLVPGFSDDSIERQHLLGL